MKTLVSKTFSRFVICCVVIFVISAPLFYLITKHYYAEDMIDIIEAVRHGNDIPPIDLEEDIMEGIMLQFVLIFGVLSVALYVTMRFITRKLWRPFDDTLRKAEAYDVTQLDVPRFASTDIREFSSLNRALERMMRRNRETYRIQKEFTENASHELQTPLAVARCKLDLLMQERLDEHSLALVTELYELNTRIEHLNRGLLLLAKIENGQYSQLQEVEPAAFIADRLSSYRLFKPDVSISMEDRRKRPATIKANLTLLESLINNLVVNALRHSYGSEYRVSITVTEDGLCVSNPSLGNALKGDEIFRRFNGTAGGNGLGLAIARAICDYHGWSISYAHQSDTHLFTVQGLNKKH